MAVYSQTQRQKQTTAKGEQKPKPPHGEHKMAVKYEAPSKNNAGQHSFLLESDSYACWLNVFVTELDAVANCCGVKTKEDGTLDTADFKGKSLVVKYGKGISKAGKEFEGVLGYSPDMTDIPF